MKIKDMPSYERPREKLYIRGLPSLTDEELMMIILKTGIKGLSIEVVAKRVLKLIKDKMLEIGDFSELLEDLKKIEGVGPAKAGTIIASFELFSRLNEKVSSSINSAGDVFPIIDFIASKKQEHLIVLNLDGRNRIISKNVVTIGLIDQSLVHSREIFINAIKERASSIILVHNHPSGYLKPSHEDIRSTENIREAGEILGIPLLDHIIVSKNGYYSFKENHLI